jgi:DUF4097 and DUF4098 domain-containing protein YvlB
MQTFATPEPISARIEAGGGSVHLLATDRADTVVRVRPHDESQSSDVWAAEHVRIDFHEGRLVVSGPKRSVPRFRTGATDIDVALPTGSRLYATLASAGLRAEGEFADIRVSAASGDVEVDVVTGKVKATNASGSITMHRVAGYASIATASGAVRVDNLEGDLKFKAASGSLSVDTLRGNIKSRTASGSVIVEAGVRGTISAHTSSGEVAVGIPAGTAVRFDISTGSGVVTNRLQSADGPAPDDETLVLHVRSGSGDVHIHRDPAGELVAQAAT